MGLWNFRLFPNSAGSFGSLAPPSIIVDNRVFILGLDELYRNAMKVFESGTLLLCARTVAKTLQLQPAQGPIEGYYGETAALTEYFRWMRSLQGTREEAESKVRHLNEFQRLWDLTNSKLFGNPQRNGNLLPMGRDPLTKALLGTAPNWNVETLTQAAYQIATATDDYSLVGLAARAQDPVLLASVRESVVLYAEVAKYGISEEPEFKYDWQVDSSLSEAANRFIDTFNQFVPDGLPKADADNAEKFYEAATDNEIIGRCVRIGKDRDEPRQYHWAVALITDSEKQGFKLVVDDFWSDQLWTTEEYREIQHPGRMNLFREKGVPEKHWGWR